LLEIARFRAEFEADRVGIEAIRKTMPTLQGGCSEPSSRAGFPATP
jgi:hypothetical protein